MTVNESVPSAFSPNADGINDTWVIDYLGIYPNCIVKIFDSRGKRVNTSEKGYPNPWDGVWNGRILPINSYFYIIIEEEGAEPVSGIITIIK